MLGVSSLGIESTGSSDPMGGRVVLGLRGKPSWLHPSLEAWCLSLSVGPPGYPDKALPLILGLSPAPTSPGTSLFPYWLSKPPPLSPVKGLGWTGCGGAEPEPST